MATRQAIIPVAAPIYINEQAPKKQAVLPAPGPAFINATSTAPSGGTLPMMGVG